MLKDVPRILSARFCMDGQIISKRSNGHITLFGFLNVFLSIIVNEHYELFSKFNVGLLFF